MDGSRWCRVALGVALVAGCASAQAPRPAPPAEAAPLRSARTADEAALAAAGDRLGFLQDHFVAVAGGAFLGGSMLLEDAARLVAAAPPPLEHAFLFRAGEEGDRSWSLPALYAGAGVGGNGLLRALGLSLEYDPASGDVVLRSGLRAARFRSEDRSCRATFLVAPASGRAPARAISLVLSSGFAETAFLAGDDVAALAPETCEIPGQATMVESMTGRRLDGRRALVRVEVPDAGVAALVDVMYVPAPAR